MLTRAFIFWFTALAASPVWAADAGSGSGHTAWLESLIVKNGLILSLPVVFLAGLALNLTPCVYPMIPVTLAFFSQQALQRTRVVLLALSYILGISLSYAALGTVAAQTGALFGAWLQKPAVLLIVSAVLVGLALSLFGVYEFRPPQAVVNRLGKAGLGVQGAFAMGLVVGLVAAPCVGPFLLGLMLLVGKLGDPVKGFILFFVLGLGMGMPYLFLALAAEKARKLPKSGQWMVWVKRVLGVVLIAMAFYLSKPLLPRSVAAWMPGALRPASGIGVAWEPFSLRAFEQARAAGQPVLIDVYADWCLPCVEMDHVTFRNPEVIEALRQVASLRIDATQEVSDDAQELLERYKVYGVPTVLFFNAAGKEQSGLRLAGFVKPDAFLKRLADALK
jgi:thiol:disulfide interchange protein DsbD